MYSMNFKFKKNLNNLYFSKIIFSIITEHVVKKTQGKASNSVLLSYNFSYM